MIGKGSLVSFLDFDINIPVDVGIIQNGVMQVKAVSGVGMQRLTGFAINRAFAIHQNKSSKP